MKTNVNLFDLVLEQTQDNLVKRTSKKNINESILELLYTKGMELTRIELVAHISLQRLKDEHGEETLQKMNPEDFKGLLTKVNKTVKNGVDTSLSRSNNNSSFHYNPKYNEYKLDQVGDKYRIDKIKK